MKKFSAVTPGSSTLTPEARDDPGSKPGENRVGTGVGVGVQG